MSRNQPQQIENRPADSAGEGGELETALDALKGAEAAIAEYFRYWTGGEMRGSYDGKPERDGLWKAQSKARAVIATIKGAAS